MKPIKRQSPIKHKPKPICLSAGLDKLRPLQQEHQPSLKVGAFVCPLDLRSLFPEGSKESPIKHKPKPVYHVDGEFDTESGKGFLYMSTDTVTKTFVYLSVSLSSQVARSLKTNIQMILSFVGYDTTVNRVRLPQFNYGRLPAFCSCSFLREHRLRFLW